MVNYVVSAEPYGFGPVAKAVAIARELSARGADVHFVGTGIALQFASESAGIFTSFHERLESIEDLDVDTVISVMEPSAALYGYARDMRVVYVDSLFWMWHWADQDLARLEDLVSDFRKITSAKEMLDRLSAVPMHDSQYLAHRLATTACVQRFGTTTGRVREHLSPIEVGAIVDLRFRDAERPRDIILASISGSANPLTSVSAARGWVETVLRVLADVRSAAGIDMEIWVSGNERVLASVAEPVDDGIRFRPQGAHTGYLELLNRAACVLAPPGITSIAEAWAYGAPFVSLPQQHYAHSDIWGRVVSAASDPAAFPDFITPQPQVADGDLVTRTAAVLDSVVGTYAPGFDPVSGRAVLELLGELSQGDVSAVLARQSEALAKVFKGPNGLHEVADVVTDSAGPRATTVRVMGEPKRWGRS